MSKRRRLSILTVVATVPAALFAQLVACGGGSNGNVDSGIHLMDSHGSGSGSGSGSGGCTASATYTPNFGSAQYAETDGSGTSGSAAHFEVWEGLLNNDADIVALELYAGAGGFGSGDIKPGTYTISGADAQYKTCGLCLRISTNNMGSGSAATYADDYLATSGTITLTETTGSNFVGTFSNATFQHVMIGSDFTSTVLNDGCTSMIGSASMNTTLHVGSGAFEEPTGFHVVLRHR